MQEFIIVVNKIRLKNYFLYTYIMILKCCLKIEKMVYTMLIINKLLPYCCLLIYNFFFYTNKSIVTGIKCYSVNISMTYFYWWHFISFWVYKISKPRKYTKFVIWNWNFICVLNCLINSKYVPYKYYISMEI